MQPAAEEEAAPVPDLMAALKASAGRGPRPDAGGEEAQADAKQGAGEEGRRPRSPAKKRGSQELSRGRPRVGRPGRHRSPPPPSRLRRSDCSGTGIRRAARGKGFQYLDADGERVDRRRGARADPRARDPAGVEGRVDLPVPGRPHPGHRHRRSAGASSTSTTRAGASAATRRSSTTWSSSPARCPALRERVDGRPRSAASSSATTCWPAPCGCWTAASSASAPRTTPSRTRPTGWRRCSKRHVTCADDVLLFDYPAKHGKRRVQAVIDPEVADGRRAPQARRGGGDGAARLQARAPLGGRKSADINAYLKEATGARHLGQGLPDLGRDRARGGRAGGRRPARRHEDRRASARSRAPSRRSPTTWATRPPSRAPRTSTRACSTATATA